MKFTPLFIASLFLVTQANASSEQDKINQKIMSTSDKGTIERLALHLTAEPFLLKLAPQPSEQMGMLLSRQYFHGSQPTVYSNGKQYKMKTGDIMVFPANIPHEFHFTKDSINIDFFAPERQDWIDGIADYIKNR